MEQAQVQVPTEAGLQEQLNSLIMQRAGLKDQLDEIEKQMPIVFNMVALLKAQRAERDRLMAAAAEASKDE